MWSLDSCDWYKNGTPLVRLLADEIYEARFDAENARGELYCSDSNATIDILELAQKIEALSK